ncbi:GNAT family N-acetyltransferase [Halopseudomonas pachastrellae]|uniref:GNAT family N-acetyltransferase n=1 Tax=Halopseudomonas pachastrellae TaxID=254161 RepID=A0A1S8DMI7_9GAMM|nr:GNAT family N-acetyltransferase [Halopseudomonas pachastrellae]ONM45587.1 GNAT family N-acetyltransferase [Halopseudomonas pachastrellae]
MTNTRVTLAAPADAERVGVLFDLYRQFYEQAADLPGAIAYLQARLQNGESVVLMAETADGQLVGFCQLYPTFCSVDMAPICVLYDLFVAADFRRQGIAEQLLTAAGQQAKARGAVRMELATAITNTPAQRLYESTGWVRDEVFFHYAMTLTD